MRGKEPAQSTMLAFLDPDARVPQDHPLRMIKYYADTVLAQLSAELDSLDAELGRPSVPPERLLKAELLIALYSSVAVTAKDPKQKTCTARACRSEAGRRAAQKRWGARALGSPGSAA